jgi:hypothetical protein
MFSYLITFRIIIICLQELNDLAKLAGYTGSTILGEMHSYRSKEERKEEIGEGLSPAQVTNSYLNASLVQCNKGWNTFPVNIIDFKW